MITLLHGTNRLAMDEWIARLRSQHDPSGLNTTFIDGSADALGDLRSACLAPGFFGTSRLVIVRDLLAERPRGRSRRGGDGANGDRDEVTSILASAPPETVILIVEQSVPPATLRALQRAVPGIEVKSLETPRGSNLVAWVQTRAGQHGGVIERDVVVLLLEALFPASWQRAARRDDVAPDLYRLDSEIAKLATAAGPSRTITHDLVAQLVPGAEAMNLWGLTNAIAAGDASAAVQEVERALAMGTPAEALIGQLASQFEAFAALAAGDRTPPGAIAAQTGLTEGRLQQASRAARRFPLERVRAGLATLRAIDTGAKLGQLDPSDALVGAVAQLAREQR